MEQQTHFFFAVKIPEETKLIIKNHIEKLKEVIPFSRWVHHEDLHITLAFLGYAPTSMRDAAVNNVKEAIKAMDPLTLQITKLGFFGSMEAPRVFWADTEENDALQTVRKEVFLACEQAGFQLETRPFRPHITLARKWNGAIPLQRDVLNDLWDRIQPEPFQFEVRDVVLYKTHLNKTPKYEVVRVFPLNSVKA
ncbi:MAG: RNA 2',3'-cyclic phosphodiesterase [Bacillus sp. (in: Bacteria)]|nr:RNA 2',3'-cyclic phosphodiesterase [Bacillus sp. (in: firmicutes)]